MRSNGHENAFYAIGPKYLTDRRHGACVWCHWNWSIYQLTDWNWTFSSGKIPTAPTAVKTRSDNVTSSGHKTCKMYNLYCISRHHIQIYMYDICIRRW